MSVCFSTRSSLRGSQRKEREKGGKMSLFSLKKHSLSLSLSFSFFLRYVMFWLSIRFFFPLFSCTSFRIGCDQALVFSLSFFPSWGDRKPHPKFVSLSLSYEARAFWKTRSPSRMLRGTQKERGMIISEKEDKLARESRKKKMDWISSHCGTRTAATKSSRVKDENAYISENKSVLPSVRPRGACLQNSFFLRCFNIYVCVYSVRSL